MDFMGCLHIPKQDQQQRKYQDGYESNIRGYQLTDGTKWHQLRGEVQVATSLTPDWKGEGVGLESSM
jgi:hypothetical protein